MGTSRYTADDQISFGNQLATARVVASIRSGIRDGRISVIRQVIATGSDRLDTLAGTIYGDARYWWVLAAASNIGWGLQIPPGTIINVIRLSDITGI